jgi:N-formylglutamate deformylase
MTTEVFRLTRGSVPLLVSMPHVGAEIAPELRARFVPRALQTEDADWHLDRLYDFLGSLGASVILPRHARYVIDLNRPPDDAPMYAGANNTELCPTRFFSGEPLYLPGCEPDRGEVQARKAVYWQPYHDALQAELARLRERHGYALLWDAHSIRCELPWLFDGRLPDLNLGTADGRSADASLARALMQVCAAQPQFTQVLDGRFKGGYITRHYGRPAECVHAVQMEMGQHLYMQDPPSFAFDESRAARVRPLLRDCLQAMLDWGRQHHGR